MRINPSAPGWIEKFSNEYAAAIVRYETDFSFYTACQRTGLFYGFVVDYHLHRAIDASHWDEEEKAKVVFFTTLFALYQLRKPNHEIASFLADVLAFYSSISRAKFSFIQHFLPESSPAQELETLIADRIQTNTNVIAKNFTHLVTNAMLFVDVLAFEHYLVSGTIDLKFFKEVEQKCMSIISLSLQIKTNKTPYDDLLIKLFENSLRYTKFSDEVDAHFLAQLQQESIHVLQRLYLLDVAQMALWSDGEKQAVEQEYVANLIVILNLDKIVQNTGFEIDVFVEKHRINIPYLNEKHPVKHFYSNAQETIAKLIIRNKNRLLKELSESKELVVLLRKSTLSELSYEEKKKVKKQLLDICKSVPSLTIFLLPGGGLLLPLLIKFIPQLLPSAFNENLDD
ncbi:LETM1-related biofilm-associated protein [Flavobacterium sp.]|jgi:hypothetical protein|uniref:LETM1-related biofilm-associated protein n=1 Tax=Flavobacterium sp. TaxID=239 RepID=UPI0037C03CA0